MDKAAEGVSPSRSRTSAQPTIGGSTYVKPQDMDWAPTQFAGVSIKVLYEDKEKGEMTCLLKWAPGTSLPLHKHPEIEQTYVLEGSFYDHDGICSAGEYVWRRGSAPSTRRIPTRVRSSWRYTVSPTFSRTAPVTLAPTTESAFEGGPMKWFPDPGIVRT